MTWINNEDIMLSDISPRSLFLSNTPAKNKCYLKLEKTHNATLAIREKEELINLEMAV